jgi:hypothetical protein
LEHEKQQLGPAFSETYADSNNEARGFEFPCRFTSFAVIDRSRTGRGTEARRPGRRRRSARDRRCLYRFVSRAKAIATAIRSGPRRPANKNSPGRLPVQAARSSFAGVLRDRLLRARRQPHARLLINPPARLASGDHVRLRHGVPGLEFWLQCRVLRPTRNLPALASSLAGRRSGSTERRSSVLTSHGRDRVDVAPAPRQFFRPPAGNGLLKPGRCSDVVLGRNVEFLQSRKRL